MVVESVSREIYARLPCNSFLQSEWWAAHKEAFGWKAWFFSIDLGGKKLGLMGLSKRVLGPFSILYLAHGPSAATLEALISSLGGEGRALARLARELSKKISIPLCLVRFEPANFYSQTLTENEVNSERKALLSWRSKCFYPGLLKAWSDIQPPDTVLLDLRKTTEDLLQAMRSKTRYNIRLAEKKMVTVEYLPPEKLGEWYRLYEETAKRDAISIHTKAYYQKLYEANIDKCELLGAFHEGELLAGIIVVYSGDTATYLYGASSNNKRNLMPAYALQFRAFQHAQQRGCTYYDFFGLPPWADEGHPMHGLFQFKTGFGGTLMHRPGAWDLPLAFGFGRIFRFLEWLRLFYFRVLRKRF